MSYDFYVKVDTGGKEPHYIEPFFDDALPVFGSDGVAGTVVVTETGHARCGNYTTNVSGMWAKCLTAAAERLPAARKWIGADAKAFNATGRTVMRKGPDGEWLRNVPLEVSTTKLTLRDLDGVQCAELIRLLQLAVEWGIEHIDELREDNPDNGWGNAEGAITYLWDIQRFCEAHPAGYLEISS